MACCVYNGAWMKEKRILPGVFIPWPHPWDAIISELEHVPATFKRQVFDAILYLVYQICAARICWGIGKRKHADIKVILKSFI